MIGNLDTYGTGGSTHLNSSRVNTPNANSKLSYKPTKVSASVQEAITALQQKQHAERTNSPLLKIAIQPIIKASPTPASALKHTSSVLQVCPLESLRDKLKSLSDLELIEIRVIIIYLNGFWLKNVVKYQTKNITPGWRPTHYDQ